jgi:hypothetical protein
MKRQYIIVGRKKGTTRWEEFGERAEPRNFYVEARFTWRPGLDNIAGAIEGLKERQPDWQFKAVRV